MNVLATSHVSLAGLCFPIFLATHQYNHYYESWAVINITIFRLQSRFTLCEPHPIHSKPKGKGGYHSRKNSGSKLKHREGTRVPSLTEDCKLKATHSCMLLGCLPILGCYAHLSPRKKRESNEHPQSGRKKNENWKIFQNWTTMWEWEMKTENLNSAGDTWTWLRKTILPLCWLFKGHWLSCKRWTKMWRKMSSQPCLITSLPSLLCEMTKFVTCLLFTGEILIIYNM